MKVLLAAAFVLFTASPAASAESPVHVAASGLITCWYNEAGQLTGADTAAPGARPGPPVRRGSGDYAWAYTIEAADGTACPRKLPQ